MKNILHIIFFLLILMMVASCEQEYIPENTGEEQKLVVEGYLEAGENPFPTYVILTRTFDFYSEIGPAQFSEAFVHDADVRVSDGNVEVKLDEICFFDLPPELQQEAAARFGFDADSLEVNFCIYIDFLNLLKPEEEKTYDLKITVDDHVITSTTHIPKHVPIDSMFFTSPPGEPSDTLAQLRISISDPPAERNFYRYFGSTNGNVYKTIFSSVEEDLFFDGKTFEFQLYNPETTDPDYDPDEFGLYFVGDTISIKWCSVDEAYFDFWNTLEFSNANQGPFSSYTRLQSNINGGLGIWGGLSVSYYTRVVEY
ncbi:MAG TPA: DUF4249 domain-containing protein [Saprospiraceae bacterium]|nr:DUF4249 domain-containing protein [Saprospiraceae bacterium]